ncbi:unnamed protein product [Orchesella dallaii]|uniref:Uncharacterized protein n=1 Tax=Orchesella dallaii TaxID=48710 RepID=A0ABP1QV67_9HEXA
MENLEEMQSAQQNEAELLAAVQVENTKEGNDMILLENVAASMPNTEATGSLTDEENVLTTNADAVVKPPFPTPQENVSNGIVQAKSEHDQHEKEIADEESDDDSTQAERGMKRLSDDDDDRKRSRTDFGQVFAPGNENDIEEVAEEDKNMDIIRHIMEMVNSKGLTLGIMQGNLTTVLASRRNTQQKPKHISPCAPPPAKVFR